MPRSHSRTPFPRGTWFRRLIFCIALVYACFPILAVLDYGCAPQASPATAAPAAVQLTPEVKLEMLHAAEEAMQQAESRLRDHFTLLLTLLGISTTVILALFSISQNQRAERTLADMEEKKRETEKILEEIRKHRESAAHDAEAINKVYMEIETASSRTAGSRTAPAYAEAERMRPSVRSSAQNVAPEADMLENDTPPAVTPSQDARSGAPAGAAAEVPASPPEKTASSTLEQLRQAAEGGDADALLVLGGRYYWGNGVPQDKAEAAEYFRKAAEQGDARAQFNLAVMYDLGEGVPQDKAKAAEWFRKAADWCHKAAKQGEVKAQFNLALMYAKGIGVRQNKAEAAKWYTKAAEQGDAKAQFNLALMYDFGEGVEQDKTEAVKWYTKAAEQGDASAQFNLARMYDFGEGVEQDKTEAVKWYTKAAEQGDAEAQFNLALMYDLGEGIEQDKTEAVKWYTKAAEQGDVSAQFNLGNMCRTGEGVPQNKVEAATWYTKAAEQGDAEAQFNLAVMYSKGDGVPQDQRQAAQWYRKAAEQGYAKAALAMSVRYFNGNGIPENDVQAYAFLLLFEALSNGDEREADDVKKLKDMLAKRLRPEDRQAAQQEAAALWEKMSQAGMSSPAPAEVPASPSAAPADDGKTA